MPAAPSATHSAPGRGERTRERVLACAAELFAARGFAPVTMRAIGEAAGLDNSSLYRHFASKSELAMRVLDRAMAGLVADLEPQLAQAPATLEGAVDVAAAGALHLWDHPGTARLVLQWVTASKDAATGFDVSLPADAVGPPSGELFRGIVSLLARARKAGAIRDVAWPEAFVALVGALALRPATYQSFLASQEPRRSRAKARAAWEAEARILARGMLAP